MAYTRHMMGIQKRLAACHLGTTMLLLGMTGAARGGVLPWQGDMAQPHGPTGMVLVDHQPSNFGGGF